MTIQWTVPLAVAFVVIAVVNTAIQAWLWTYPMAPDPTGREGHGVTTAPRFWRYVHRGLGYVFIAIYIAIMFEMVPRAWRYTEGWNGRVIAHALMGILVGPILLAKILILRRFKRFGHRLPWFGGTLCGMALVLVGLVIAPAWRLSHGPESVAESSMFATSSQQSGKWVAMNRCLQCHGPGTVLEERRDAEEWLELTADMQDFAAGTRTRLPITDEHRAAVSTFLSSLYGEEGGAADDGQGRGRGRGRGRGGGD